MPSLDGPEPGAPGGSAGSAPPSRGFTNHPRVLFLVGVIALGVVSFPFFIASIDGEIARSHRASGDVPVRPAPPDGLVEFGTGGDGCALGSSSTTFTVRDQIRFVGRLASP